MDNKIEAALVKDFPELFRDINKPMTETCMCWGCDCGNGWEPILRRAFNQLYDIEPPIVLDQVKEKYGGLRIYYHGGPRAKRRWFGWIFWLPGLLFGIKHNWRRLPRSLFHCFRVANVNTYKHSIDVVQGIVDAAEAESFRVCESCGACGAPNHRGWISTLCGKCRAK